MTGTELAATDVALPALPAGLGPAAQRFARNTLRKSKQTQRTYLSVYGRFALHLAAMTGLQDPPPLALTADAVASYLDGLEAQGRSPATVRKERAAINRLTRYLQLVGAIDQSTALEILDVEAVTVSGRSKPRLPCSRLPQPARHCGLYGYKFEHEGTYDKFCLVNDAVYVAGVKPVPWEEPFPNIEWTAVGAQFQHPYVFKTLFSGEDISFDDMCEARSVVKGAMYLDYDHSTEPDITKMRHVGKTGQFVPVLEEGAKLYRVHDDKYYAISGTKKQLWMEAHVARTKENLKIDMSYFESLKDAAIETIEKFGSFEEFIN